MSCPRKNLLKCHFEQSEKSLIALAVAHTIQCPYCIDAFIQSCLEKGSDLAKGLYPVGRKIHVSEMTGPPAEGLPIAVADHCYTCTAIAGFT